MSKLHDHLKDTGETMTSFARRVGMSQPYMSLIANFRREPRLRQALRIERATKGKIPVEYWIESADAKAAHKHMEESK